MSYVRSGTVSHHPMRVWQDSKSQMTTSCPPQKYRSHISSDLTSSSSAATPVSFAVHCPLLASENRALDWKLGLWLSWAALEGANNFELGEDPSRLKEEVDPKVLLDCDTAIAHADPSGTHALATGYSTHRLLDLRRTRGANPL